MERARTNPPNAAPSLTRWLLTIGLLTCGLLTTTATTATTPQADQQTPLLWSVDKPSTIECVCTDVAAKNEYDVAVDSGTYHYRAVLPEGYWTDADATFPVLIAACATGSAPLNKEIAGFVRRHRWIALLLVESRNGPVAPSNGNFVAAYDDAVQRFRIDTQSVFLTGMSGGARASSMFAMLRPGIAGLMCQAAAFTQRPTGDYDVRGCTRHPDMAVVTLIGTDDPNHGELARIDAALPETTRRKNIDYDGVHGWASVELTEDALTWLSAQHSAVLNRAVEASQNPLSRYAAISAVLRWLPHQPATPDSGALAALRKEHKSLERSRPLADEARAMRTMAKASKRLSKLYTTLDGVAADAIDKGLRRKITALQRRFEALAKKHDGTAAARRASRRAAELELILEDR